AGDVAAGLADDAPRPGDDPRGGAGRDRAGADPGRWMSMEGPRRDARWWGWGDPAIAPELDAEALAVLRERVGELEPAPRKGDLGDFELPAAQSLPTALVEVVGADGVFDSTEVRVRRAAGRGDVSLATL